MFGYIVWGDVPDAFILCGGTLVIASGLYILHWETKQREAHECASIRARQRHDPSNLFLLMVLAMFFISVMGVATKTAGITIRLCKLCSCEISSCSRLYSL